LATALFTSFGKIGGRAAGFVTTRCLMLTALVGALVAALAVALVAALVVELVEWVARVTALGTLATVEAETAGVTAFAASPV